MSAHVSVKAGTITGTLLSLVPNLPSEDIIRTLLLAAVGAVASFFVTLLLKWLTRPKKR